MKVSGKCMNLVYDVIDSLSDNEIKYARDIECYGSMPPHMWELFRYQCNYILDKRKK